MKNGSAIDRVLADDFDVLPDREQSQPLFDFDFDYAAVLSSHAESVEAWKSFTPEERQGFSGKMEKFLEAKGVRDPKDKELSRARNAHLVRSEVAARLGDSPNLKVLPLGAVDYKSSLSELIESLENVDQIKNLYRLRKITSGSSRNSGINSDEALKLKNCLSQGRELYFAGSVGSLMVKPLNHFYSVTAYSYGAIILNSPIRYSKDSLPSSHGMTYLPDVVQGQFGGDSPIGTFSELFSAFPSQLIRTGGIEFIQDCTGSIREFFRHRINVSIGTLLSMLPEMSNYYSLMTARRSRAYPLEIVNANNPKTLVWEFHIGDGASPPSREIVDKSFPGFDISERYGKYVVSVPATRASEVKALIYTDIEGRLSFIDNPFFPVLLPEICVHFLLNHIYSCIMRYRPEEWGNVILNEVSSDTSLLTRHYFSNFERKFLLLALRCLSGYYPVVETSTQ